MRPPTRRSEKFLQEQIPPKSILVSIDETLKNRPLWTEKLVRSPKLNQKIFFANPWALLVKPSWTGGKPLLLIPLHQQFRLRNPWYRLLIQCQNFSKENKHFFTLFSRSEHFSGVEWSFVNCRFVVRSRYKNKTLYHYSWESPKHRFFPLEWIPAKTSIATQPSLIEIENPV